MATRIEVQSFIFNPIVVIGVAVFVTAVLLNFYPIVVGVIVVSTFAGLWYNVSQKTGLLKAFHMGSTILILLTAICLLIPFILSDQIAQEMVAQLALPSLILALLAITTSNFTNLTNEQKHANMETKVTTICKNTQVILDKINSIESIPNKLKQQNPFPEEDTEKNIILPELHDNGDTKIITTQCTSDDVTVTSTIKITFRRE